MEKKSLYTGLGLMALVAVLGFRRKASASEPVLVKKMETVSKDDIPVMPVITEPIIPKPDTIIPKPVPVIPISESIIPVLVKPVPKESVLPELPKDHLVSEALKPFFNLEAVQIDPISLTPPDTELIKPGVDLEMTKVNAEYQIPLYNLANRDIVYNYYKQMTSMGFALNEIDLSAIPTATWVKMGFDIAFSAICACMGPVGWIMGGVKALMGYLTGKSPEEQQAEEEAKVKESVEAFKTFYKVHKISTQSCMFLGTLAKNRVGSHLIPLVKVYNSQFEDETYITGNLLPIFTEGGYTTTGKALGYISTLPFPHSVLIKLMFSFELMDFVLVVDGSEFERVLTHANYFPVTELGYVSRVIQPGQQGEVSKDYGTLEVTHSVDQKGIRFLLGHVNPTVSYNRYLRGNVALPAVINKSVLTKAGLPTKVLDPQDYAANSRFHVTDKVWLDTTKPGAEATGQWVDRINTNPRTGQLATNSGIITTDVLSDYKTAGNNPLYGVLNRLPIPKTYQGFAVPSIGCSSGLIGNKLLLQQVNGALVEIHLLANMDIKHKQTIAELVKPLAIAIRPKYALRMVLGPFFKNIEGRPVYIITSLDDLKNTLFKYNAEYSLWRI